MPAIVVEDSSTYGEWDVEYRYMDGNYSSEGIYAGKYEDVVAWHTLHSRNKTNKVSKIDIIKYTPYKVGEMKKPTKSITISNSSYIPDNLLDDGTIVKTDDGYVMQNVEAINNAAKEVALAKLTPQERKLLGLE